MNEERAEKILTEITGKSITVTDVKQAHGGCISEAWIIKDLQENYFLKQCGLDSFGMFKAEATGLKELARCQEVKVPALLGLQQTSEHGYLLLEALNLESHNDSSQRKLGYGLAELHKITSDKHGFHENNYIGSTPQINNPYTSWIDFYTNCRLMPQAYMTGNDEIIDKSELLSTKLSYFFESYTPVPSLLHGDLWGGNSAKVDIDTPVIFDPAVYYGDRETDLAFTEFFGGFTQSFYAAYNERWPLDQGYRDRKYLYQLYHSLNHLNLFGTSYQSRSLEILNHLLKLSQP